MRYIIFDTCNGEIKKMKKNEIGEWIAHFICDFHEYYHRTVFSAKEKRQLFLFIQMACYFIGFPYSELTDNDKTKIIENNDRYFNSVMGDIWEANISAGRW